MLFKNHEGEYIKKRSNSKLVASFEKMDFYVYLSRGFVDDIKVVAPREEETPFLCPFKVFEIIENIEGKIITKYQYNQSFDSS